jgi:uncharacterized protein (TIGR03086 family)
MFDLTPAATEMSRLVREVRDDQLGDPTPDDGWQVSHLLTHVHEFATVFTLNARKAPVELADGLPDDWRTTIPGRLDELADAWRDPAAWEGRVSAGGVEMSAPENALVALEELVLHGWDLARSVGAELRLRDEDLAKVEEFQALFGPAIESGQGPYGPPVEPVGEVGRLERVLGVAGRDHRWSPPRS